MDEKRIRLKIAAPCAESWDRMQGDDAVRHCGRCRKDVYQLSAMSTGQVENLLADKRGELCVRFYQRADGTVMTSDCAPGVAKRRRKLALVGLGAGVMSALGLAVTDRPCATPNAPHTIAEEIEQLERRARELLVPDSIPVMMGGDPYLEPTVEVLGGLEPLPETPEE